MLRSAVNLFGDSSSFCVNELKKILIPSVPQDQFNKISDIPGFVSGKKTVSETSSLVSREYNKNFSEEDTTSGSTKSVAIENEKPSNNNCEQEFRFFNNMEKGLVQNFELHSKLLLQKNEESDIHFMDSAVQCKMSQSSQSVFEMPLTERLDLLTASKEIVASEDFDEQEKIKLTSICEESELPSSAVASIMKTVSKASDNKENENAIVIGEKESSVETFSKNIAYEESFVSHSIPSAQPCSADLQNGVSHQKIETTHVNEPPVVFPGKSSEKNKPTTKRKRYNKLEKDSKKLKSLSDINITYSSEQIKSMIELMKLFNKL